MKKMIVLLAGIFFCGGVSAARLCTYTSSDSNQSGWGTEERQGMTLYPKISADPTLPVGSILYSRTVGGMNLHTRQFTCEPGAQYIIYVSRPEIPGLTVRGMPVYETGVDGIGIQFSDISSSRVGKQTVGKAGSWPTPFSQSSQVPVTPFFSAWLIKTGPIDTSGATNINVEIEFRVADPADLSYARKGAIYWVNPKTTRAISFRNESCNISLKGPGTVDLQRIAKSDLLALARGATTGKGKAIDMNITCPTELQGKKLTYWFNPKGAVGADPGVLENTAGAGGANNVGIILKKNNIPMKFFDTDAYTIPSLSLDQDISFTADYYMINPAITDGPVKAVLEVVIQED
ncbi:MULTISPECIES: fimbrial protein [Raoultella]|uniref:fimbrial protein n=1 Tax=Raoultella TaxID=160674 RepID=UPI002167AFBC|nr:MULTISPECIES: fimbrial protein [Raoultella]MCS4272497.1 type 1 fimbria pilin [Raoultella sp. BIGb0132]MCS4289166.1 type 1 fimbria pilin [Raoultella terrigena]